ncbi:MAG TPA: thioesterase family protein [Allosphingosinicella sp.]|jgi:hypothetical protein
MVLDSSIFRHLNSGLYEATAAAAGPWSATHCHGGAPAALLAAALEDLPLKVPMDLARFTIDLVRPVPISTPLRIKIDEGRQGSRVQLVTADLLAGGVLLATASGLRVRSVDPNSSLPMRPPPDVARHQSMPGGFSAEFTIVPVSGGFGRLGPASVWFRLGSSLVAGADTSPVARCIAAADFGSGVAHELSFEAWEFPSLDLTVSLARPPNGSWTLLESRWLRAQGGRTSCLSSLSDLQGPFGTAIQTVLIEPRRNQ